MFERTPRGIDSIEALLLDLSGVLYVGDDAVPGAQEAVKARAGCRAPAAVDHEHDAAATQTHPGPAARTRL